MKDKAGIERKDGIEIPEILTYTKVLETEMNLRLLLEQSFKETVLFVEHISIADISYPVKPEIQKEPEKQRRKGFLRRVFTYIKRFLSASVKDLISGKWKDGKCF